MTPIEAIPLALSAIVALAKALRGEKNNKRRNQSLDELDEHLTFLTEAIVAYADAHFQLRDWKLLHDGLTRITELLDLPHVELGEGKVPEFQKAWSKPRPVIAELTMDPFENLPEKWLFDTPGGTRSSDWRLELRMRSDRVSNAKTLETIRDEFDILRELVRVLTLRANKHLIQLAGKLADESAELKGKLGNPKSA